MGYLTERHLAKGGLSFTTGASGSLPCSRGLVVAALARMGAFDPDLVQSSLRRGWVAAAIEDMDGLTEDGKVTLVKNYGREVLDLIPFEPLGEPSRFLTHQWLSIRRTFGLT